MKELLTGLIGPISGLLDKVILIKIPLQSWPMRLQQWLIGTLRKWCWHRLRSIKQRSAGQLVSGLVEATMRLCLRLRFNHQLSHLTYCCRLECDHPASGYVGHDARAFGNAWSGNSTILQKSIRSFQIIDWHTALLTAVSLNTAANLIRLWLKMKKWKESERLNKLYFTALRQIQVGTLTDRQRTSSKKSVVGM